MEKEKDWLPVSDVMRMANGLPMPEKYYKAEFVNGYYNDALHIHKELLPLGLMQRANACMLYSEAYKGLESRKDCNTRLREYVKRCKDVNEGKTVSPKRVKEGD